MSSMPVALPVQAGSVRIVTWGFHFNGQRVWLLISGLGILKLVYILNYYYYYFKYPGAGIGN